MLTSAQIRTIEALKAAPGFSTVKQILRNGGNMSSVRALIEKGIVKELYPGYGGYVFVSHTFGAIEQKWALSDNE